MVTAGTPRLSPPSGQACVARPRRESRTGCRISGCGPGGCAEAGCSLRCVPGVHRQTPDAAVFVASRQNGLLLTMYARVGWGLPDPSNDGLIPPNFREANARALRVIRPAGLPVQASCHRSRSLPIGLACLTRSWADAGCLLCLFRIVVAPRSVLSRSPVRSAVTASRSRVGLRSLGTIFDRCVASRAAFPAQISPSRAASDRTNTGLQGEVQR